MKNGKKCLEIWWAATALQNLALIRLMVFEKTHFTDDGWMSGQMTDDECPHHGISSAHIARQNKHKCVGRQIKSKYYVS